MGNVDGESEGLQSGANVTLRVRFLEKCSGMIRLGLEVGIRIRVRVNQFSHEGPPPSLNCDCTSCTAHRGPQASALFVRPRGACAFAPCDFPLCTDQCWDSSGSRVALGCRAVTARFPEELREAKVRRGFLCTVCQALLSRGQGRKGLCWGTGSVWSFEVRWMHVIGLWVWRAVLGESSGRE